MMLVAALRHLANLLAWRARPGDRGQTTAEYALVVVGAALVAVLLIAWATAGGGAAKIGALLDRVFDSVITRVS